MESVSLGSAARAVLELLPAENFCWNPYSIPFLIAAVFILFVGSYVFMHGVAFYQRIAFLAVCWCFFMWLAGTFLIYSIENQEMLLAPLALTYAGVSFLAPSLLWYASVWLGQARPNKNSILLGYFLGLVLLAVIVRTRWIVYGFTGYFWGFHSRLTVLGGIAFLTFFSGYLFLFYRTLFRGYKREKKAGRETKQITLVLGAFIIANLGCSDFLPCYGVEIFPLGALTLVGATGVLAYTIIQYKLFDIETVIHKTIMWVVVSSLILLPILLLSHVLNPWYRRAHPLEVGLLCVGIFYFLTMYLKMVQPHVDHLFQRRKYDLERASEKFISDLIHLKSPEDLAKKIQETIIENLYTEKVEIFLSVEHSKDFSLIPRQAGRAVSALSREDPFLQWLVGQNELAYGPYVQADPKYETVRHEASSYFKHFQIALAIPLVLDERPLGIIHLGRKANLKPYTSYDFHFLRRLKNESTIALSNSLLYGRVEEEVRLRSRELVEMQAQLVQAEKMATIGTLAGGIAHEINNPLTAVLTNAQILKMDAREEDLASVSLIEEGAKRCQLIIQKLMKYSRKSQDVEVMQKVDVSKVVANVIAFLDYQLKQENIEVVVTQESGEAAVNGNANELEQVVTNLILNAKDAIQLTGRRSGKIEVKTAEAANDLAVIVTDDGIGIRKGNLDKIFDPFFTTKEIGKGTGLGLAVTYGIVEKYRGRIEVRSDYGKGSSFIVRLPKAS